MAEASAGTGPSADLLDKNSRWEVASLQTANKKGRSEQSGLSLRTSH